MKRKNILCVCISALLIFGLAGCGEEREDDGMTDTVAFQSEETSQEQTTKQEILYQYAGTVKELCRNGAAGG